MKIVQINGGVFGSTGKIMFGIAREAKRKGHEVICASPVTVTNRKDDPKEEYIKIGSFYGRCLSVLLARITGYEGCFAIIPTLKFLYKIDRFSPNIIHLHSIHNSYLNLPLLFRYIKRKNIKTIWTLHDCWSFTGHCAHFEISGCTQWEKECTKCKSFHQYPKSYMDNAWKMYRLKKKWFTGIHDLTIITPSKWLAEKVNRSFLKDYPVKVINNGIDLSVFHATESDFRRRHKCMDKCVLLGVSFGWDDSKGLDVFIKLARSLGREYRIVLVGTSETVEKKLPENIISIHRTKNQKELAELYSASDLFINPTREDTFPTVNMEALACGTPIITYETGGSPEIINDKCGKCVPKNDYEELVNMIIQLKNWKASATQECEKQAKNFNMTDKYKEVIEVYENSR